MRDPRDPAFMCRMTSRHNLEPYDPFIDDYVEPPKGCWQFYQRCVRCGTITFDTFDGLCERVGRRHYIWPAGYRRRRDEPVETLPSMRARWLAANKARIGRRRVAK